MLCRVSVCYSNCGFRFICIEKKAMILTAQVLTVVKCNYPVMMPGMVSCRGVCAGNLHMQQRTTPQVMFPPTPQVVFPQMLPQPVQVLPPRYPGALATAPASPPQIYHESHHKEGADAQNHKGEDHSSGKHKTSSGGSSVGHHETKNTGHEKKETAKTEHGSHKGDKSTFEDSAYFKEGGKKKAGQKHYEHHKDGKKKKGMKMSKGFHEEYHKDEKKSKGSHWKTEHSDGKYIKFGKKRGKGGTHDAKKANNVEKRNDDPTTAGNFGDLHQIVSVQWSKKRKPVYKTINYNHQRGP